MSWVRKLHKWASVLVGLQLFLWVASGLYFNLMDHTKAAGHTYFHHEHGPVVIDYIKLVEPKAVLENNPPSVSISVISLLNKPYYLLTHQQGLYRHFKNDYSLVDGVSGERVQIDMDFASQLAQASYAGEAPIASVQLLVPPLDDFPKQQNVTWQVNFADDIATSVYVEAGSGRIVGHSDQHKRLADIFFMLHFMDYTNQGSFNNIQIMLLAFIGLWLSASGSIWTVDMLLRRKYRLKLTAKKPRLRSTK
ncbi:PepSY domain-containing protein [Shewanella aestuarii]|uniref:PepSY domain-containing protein n=1 Tax=Shewanella aestuarii TaxID=1028752 RepID=A0A6G9QPB6_9GAMM|nr:PepSY domain-containing protein [Shewanella aestuarii]QIR15905.1 hypothetical protein HBH39_16675 [Shewanella aestuarii]